MQDTDIVTGTLTSISTTHPDGSVTVTLAAGISNNEWVTAVAEIQGLYPGRDAHWLLDIEGRDVFEISAPVPESRQSCWLCDAGQPHGHTGAMGAFADGAAHQAVARDGAK